MFNLSKLWGSLHFHVPLLQQWQPLFYMAPFCSDTGFIGDEAAGDYAWLLPADDWSVSDSTDWLAVRPKAFLLVRDTVFSLLPTVCPIPVNALDGKIIYNSPVIADRRARRGYVHGFDKHNRHYILCVEYDKTPAPLTLYYTDPLPDAGFPEIVLTDHGDLMIVGGTTYNKSLGGTLENDNFSPLATVYLLRLNNGDDASKSKAMAGTWPWVFIALLVVVVVAARCLLPKRRNHRSPATGETIPAESPSSVVHPNEALMQRICELMEQQQLYLNSNLKLKDLATMLATNRSVISSCINGQRGCSFSQFVAEYRVGYAQELMRCRTDMKMSEVWMESGFSNESSFFRTFKNHTGVTPTEWKLKIAK